MNKKSLQTPGEARMPGPSYKDFILKVPNSSNRMDIKEGREINIGWNSFDCRALDPK